MYCILISTAFAVQNSASPAISQASCHYPLSTIHYPLSTIH